MSTGPDIPPVMAQVPGQERAVAFLSRAAGRPAHAYLFSGPEGSGKRLGMRAFAAALLCVRGGCGECRDCRLALQERHPNFTILEPRGSDILVGRDATDPDTARGFARLAAMTPPEPGRRVMAVLQADRLRTEAADVLLKVLEEPAGETVFLLTSARLADLPETIASRCQEVAFAPLGEGFVVRTLVEEGFEQDRAVLAARLAGANVGRARRLIRDEEGLAFRDAGLEAVALAQTGPAGALTAAEGLIEKSRKDRERVGKELDAELAPFLDERGRPEAAFRGVVRRLKDEHARRARRADREFLDRALLALTAWFRDIVVTWVGAGLDMLINVDLADGLGRAEWSGPAAGLAMAAVEEARAALADETNLNARLVLDQMLLRIGELAAR